MGQKPSWLKHSALHNALLTKSRDSFIALLIGYEQGLGTLKESLSWSNKPQELYK